MSDLASGAGGDIGAKIAAQGDLVRQLKGDKKSKEEIDTAVKQLLALKVSLEIITNSTCLLSRLSSRLQQVLTGNQQEELLLRSRIKRRRRRKLQR